jgi:YVTN family beta-propeller protein
MTRVTKERELPRALLGLGLVAAMLCGCTPARTAPPTAPLEPGPAGAPATSLRPAATTTRPPTTTAPAEAAPARPSPQRRMRLARTIAGNISPKSVVASGSGRIIAQNMMYRHSITVYDRSYRLVKTISDRVELEALGGPATAGPVRGAPVEAAFSPDGRYAYVSNYSMYGPGYTREGSDTCSPVEGIDPSFVYRLDMARLAVDRVGRVGQVPKYVAATGDGRLVLVTNWCSYDLSILSARTLKERRRIGLGAYPRGIAVDPRSRTAYVAVMGSTRIAVVDLRSFRVRWIEGVGAGPRHLVIDPAGSWLYVTLNGEGRVAKIDLRSRRVVDRVATGSAPRSMTIAEDGRSLYVVNYNSGTVSKLRASDLRVLQVVTTNRHPIGITYDVHDGAGYVWVACYTGTIKVFKDN